MLFDLTQQPNSSQLNISRASSSKLLNESHISPRLNRKKTLKDYEFISNDRCRLKSSELGKGAYGMVKKVKDIETGKTYALKIMNKQVLFAYSTKENLKREITIQKKVSHPHIVKLYNFFEDEENVYLVLQLAEKGSLFHYLRDKKTFAENEAFVFFFQTCLGIDHLHKRNIIHRDIKPENLLLDSSANIKLCDFGWSIDTNCSKQTFCGTVDYMAPEMVKNQSYDHRIDIWSLGVLLYELLHGCAPYKGKTDREKTQNISANAKINYDVTLSKEAVDLIKKILKQNPEDRLTLLEIFSHPWMKKHEKLFNVNIMEYVAQNDQGKDARRNASPKKQQKENMESPKLAQRSPKKQKRDIPGRSGPYFSPKVNRGVDPLVNLQENSMISEKFSNTDEKKHAGDIMQRVDLIVSVSKVLDVPKLSLDHRAKSVAPSNRMLYQPSNNLGSGDYRHQYSIESEVMRRNYADSLHYSLQSEKSLSGIMHTTIGEESIDQFVQQIYGSNQKVTQFESPYQPYTSPFLTTTPSSFKYQELSKAQTTLSGFAKKQIEIPEQKSDKKAKQESSFFEEMLISLGCISRKDPNKLRKVRKIQL